jgi:hypothetical protein
MIEYWSERREADRINFEPFREAVQRDCPDVRFAWIGGNLLVIGTVRTYNLKTEIDMQASMHGLAIQNCVRVVPGREWILPEGMPIAG